MMHSHSLVGRRTNVLDDGFVRVVDLMGDDRAIVNAARLSYDINAAYGIDSERARQDDRGLIRYLMRNRHTTPFEMCEIKFHVRAPIEVMRQWLRHRMWSYNEYSMRYSEAIASQQKTAPDAWRFQSKDNKQGSGGFLSEDVGRALTNDEVWLQEAAEKIYQERLTAGVAKEQARKDLPLSTYTEVYAKVDLHNLLHFLSLRMDPHAQLEIRSYANAIAEIVKTWVPFAWEAFQDFRLQGMALSRLEVEALAAHVMMLQGYVTSTDLETVTIPEDMGGTERKAFIEKLRRFGLDKTTQIRKAEP
jgi:thymidylate synthase (FAD)